MQTSQKVAYVIKLSCIGMQIVGMSVN